MYSKQKVELMKIVASAAIGMGDIFGLGGGMIGLAVGMMVVSRIKEEETGMVGDIEDIGEVSSRGDKDEYIEENEKDNRFGLFGGNKIDVDGYIEPEGGVEVDGLVLQHIVASAAIDMGIFLVWAGG